MWVSGGDFLISLADWQGIRNEIWCLSRVYFFWWERNGGANAAKEKLSPEVPYGDVEVVLSLRPSVVVGSAAAVAEVLLLLLLLLLLLHELLPVLLLMCHRRRGRGVHAAAAASRQLQLRDEVGVLRRT